MRPNWGGQTGTVSHLVLRTNLLHIAAVEQRKYLRSVRADPSAAYRTDTGYE
jgi:hypothetical protein